MQDGPTFGRRAMIRLGHEPNDNGMSELRLQSESVEYPVSFQSFRQPAVNPYRFRGKGSVAVHDGLLGLEGKKRIPLWFSRRETVIVPLENILDVAIARNAVTFHVQQQTSSKRRTRPVRLFFNDEGSARAFANALPSRLSERTSRRQADAAEFETRLSAHASRCVVVPALIALNVLVYVLLGTKGAGWIGADSSVLIQWGSNFGPLTTGGQWWRLGTAVFLHGGLLHLLFNMYALYDTGPLCERLVGRVRFIALYALSGLLGNAVSVWWNPYVNSVGASGAIFGVYGALLAFMIDKRNGVPATIMQTHAVSISIFIVYAVYNGLAKTGIDNAAHLGGLLGGLILGWAFARPLGEDRSATGIFRPIAGAAAAATALIGLLVLTPNTRSAYDAHQHFLADVKWLDAEEKKLIAGARAASERAANPRSKPADIKHEFAAVAQGWSEVHRRLATYRLDPRVSSRELIDLKMDLEQYAELRGRAMRALAVAADARSADQEQASQEFKRLWKESDAVLQRMNDRAKVTAGQDGRRR